MNQETEERIKIISEFKSTLYQKDQSLEKRINMLKIFGLLKYVLANFMLILVMVHSAIVILRLDPSGQSWQKAGLLVFIALNLSFHSHYSYIELLLLKHIKNLLHRDMIIQDGHNRELNKLIDDLNYHKFRPYWLIFTAFILLLASVLKFFNFNPFWHLFALPVLIVGALLSVRLNQKVSLIRNNIELIESKV